MSVKYLYFTEGVGTGGSLSAAHAIPGLDQFLYMFGGERMCVHPAGADYAASAEESFDTLAAAQAAYSLHQWLYLDPAADVFLDEVSPAADNVVYAVGHDLTGYGGEPLNGNTYKLRVLPVGFVGHAITCLSVAAVDRWIRLRPWL